MTNSTPLQTKSSKNSSLIKNIKETKVVSMVLGFPVEYTTLFLCCLLSLAAVIFFLLLIKPLVFLRADILMWGETEFIGNIIKLNIGAPLYTDPADSNSMIYNPGTFLLTYAIAWVSGLTKSVVGLRLIQFGYVIIATIIATYCSFNIHKIAFPEKQILYRKTWILFIFFSLLLAATAPFTNQFVYALHVDALALLISAITFWAMLRYSKEASLKNLLILAMMPALGFLTKQFLISWIGIIFFYLLLLNPKDIKRLITFTVISGGLTLFSIGVCYLIWGDNYLFWAFEVMGERKKLVLATDSFNLSLTRSIDHLLRVWPAIAVGIFGGWLLIRKSKNYHIKILVISWFLLVLSEALSSGAGWEVLYHFGPGVLIGATFMFAALMQIWSQDKENIRNPQVFLNKLGHSFLLLTAICSIYIAWGAMPTGDHEQPRYLRAIQTSPDIDRYISEIENEFEGLPPEKVLLGIGNWIYLKHDVLQKDRAVSLNDQGPGRIKENFDISIKRIRKKTYSKILLQNFDSPFFLYEWDNWPKPTGFRTAILENYVKVRTIESPKGNPDPQSQILLANPVTVFIPRK